MEFLGAKFSSNAGHALSGADFRMESARSARQLIAQSGETTIASGANSVPPWVYPSGNTHAGDGTFWQGIKPGCNLSELPLPSVGSKADLWGDYCPTKVDVTKSLPAAADRQPRHPRTATVGRGQPQALRISSTFFEMPPVAPGWRATGPACVFAFRRATS